MNTANLFQVEMERYTAIPRMPCITRPNDWLREGEFIVCKVVEGWTFGKVVFLGGGGRDENDPRVFSVCTAATIRRCDPSEHCSGCFDCLWADLSRANVLGKKDLIRIGVSPELISPTDPLCGIMSPVIAQQFLDRIKELEKKEQSRRLC